MAWSSPAASFFTPVRETLHMARQSDADARSHCRNCGHEADVDGWDVVSAPPLGELTQCPECGSTDVTSGR